MRAALVYFDQDPLFPTHESTATARHLGSNTEVVTVANAGHAGLLTRPIVALIELLARLHSG
ncbi:hypothetical protein [Rhodococcus artemisiae]|uniref:TAP-like protein n=1 Tax=Rhodococcus artemisiae TaxID=714159 RepID=A0ABU7LJH2_9NOCA|nr:hypothetical protein [Rhodococcus artemisiae]MEE2061711.1 hypothetical protein [Rhodococcus artemisiae]